MFVKFTKKQIKALASVESRAESIFTELHKKDPSLYRESDRSDTVRMYKLGILDSIIELGGFYV